MLMSNETCHPDAETFELEHMGEDELRQHVVAAADAMGLPKVTAPDAFEGFTEPEVPFPAGYESQTPAQRILQKIAALKEKKRLGFWDEVAANDWRLAESAYFAKMTEVADGSPGIAHEIKKWNKPIKEGYFEYLASIKASYVQRGLQRVRSYSPLVIGGEDGTKRVAAVDEYNPEIHTHIFRGKKRGLPEPGDTIYIAASEVGVKRNGRYELIYPAIYCTPNRYGNIDVAVFEEIHKLALQAMGE